MFCFIISLSVASVKDKLIVSFILNSAYDNKLIGALRTKSCFIQSTTILVCIPVATIH